MPFLERNSSLGMINTMVFSTVIKLLGFEVSYAGSSPSFPTDCVILAKLFNLSHAQFHHLNNEEKKTCFLHFLRFS